MKSASLWLLILCALLSGRVATANPAYTQGYTHLRAGPSVEYPLVVTLPPNTLLDVNGCIDDFSWCDVDWQGNRGWVFGNYLFYEYQDRRVPVLEFGAALGIGIVAFSIGDYWGRYYTGRPWYRRESYWMHRPPPPRHPPGFRPGVRPPGWGARPPMGRPPGGGHGIGNGGRPPPRPSPPAVRPPLPGRPSPGPGGGQRPGPGQGGGGARPTTGGAGGSAGPRPGRGGPRQQRAPGPQGVPGRPADPGRADPGQGGPGRRPG